MNIVADILSAVGRFLNEYGRIFWAVWALYNLIVFITYGVDKRKAIKGAWRISEATLVGLALFGGAFGAFAGMYLLRHKTKHAKFFIIVPLALLLQVLIVVASYILA